MQWLFVFFMIGSFFFALITGRMDALCKAALESASDGVTLCLTLLGSMGFWSGMLQIAEDAGLMQTLNALMQKPISLLFGGLKDKQALSLIGLNLCANLLGLGNAATPLGLKAMKRLDTLNHAAAAPSFPMAMLVVINTASLQLIPTTVGFLRSQAGSETPFSILPAALLTSACALIAVILTVNLLYRKQKRET